jgi:hypothetical protein
LKESRAGETADKDDPESFLRWPLFLAQLTRGEEQGKFARNNIEKDGLTGLGTTQLRPIS